MIDVGSLAGLHEPQHELYAYCLRCVAYEPAVGFNARDSPKLGAAPAIRFANTSATGSANMANTSFWKLLPIAISLSTSACDGGVYQTSTSGDGGVVVVNRYSGSIRKVEGDKVVDLGPSTKQAGPNSQRTFTSATIPKQPVRIDGRAKFYNDAMLILVSVNPNLAKMSDDDWAAWREHIDICRSGASIHLEFMDSDGFELYSQDLSLSDMRRIVNSKGDMSALSAQVKIPIDRKTYDAISYWQVGWAGWTEQPLTFTLDELRGKQSPPK